MANTEVKDGVVIESRTSIFGHEVVTATDVHSGKSATNDPVISIMGDTHDEAVAGAMKNLAEENKK